MTEKVKIARIEHHCYSQDNDKTSRSITLADGQSFIVSMENRCWAALDWLTKERDFELDRIVAAAHANTTNFHSCYGRSFVEQFPISFKWLVMDYAYWETNGIRGIAND